MSEFWSWWVIIIVAINILGCWGLLYWTRTIKESEVENTETTGHVYDGIEEYNNPLPRWWLIMFYITLVFGIGYLILYPGLGNQEGALGWTAAKQHAEEIAKAEKTYQPLFEKYINIPVEELVNNKQAIEMGKRIFVSTCYGCHGSDARGNPGYPDLTDNDWLWGGSPDVIKRNITNGIGQENLMRMNPFADILTAQQIDELVQYVGSLSGEEVDNAKAEKGQATFMANCVACHGADGKGMQALGSPNLTDDIWLYSGSASAIAKTIREGRGGYMPPHGDFLGEAKTHLVTAYVYSLSADK